MPCSSTPSEQPRAMLTSVMITIPAIASPSDELARRRPWPRRSRPGGRSARAGRGPVLVGDRPACRSASIAICRPGIPSSMNRAATSPMRVAPFVITTNWITTRMQEHDHPHEHVPADDERAERADHVAGVPVQEHEPGDADVDPEPEERRQEQERREGREVERTRHVHRRDEDHQGAADVDRDEDVDQRARQRHEHHRDHDDDADRGQQVVVAQEELQPAAHGSATHLGGQGSGRSGRRPRGSGGEAKGVRFAFGDPHRRSRAPT